MKKGPCSVIEEWLCKARHITILTGLTDIALMSRSMSFIKVQSNLDYSDIFSGTLVNSPDNRKYEYY